MKSAWLKTKKGRVYTKLDKLRQRIKKAGLRTSIKFCDFEYWYAQINKCKQCGCALDKENGGVFLRYRTENGPTIIIFDLFATCAGCYRLSVTTGRKPKLPKINICNKCGVEIEPRKHLCNNCKKQPVVYKAKGVRVFICKYCGDAIQSKRIRLVCAKKECQNRRLHDWYVQNKEGQLKAAYRRYAKNPERYKEYAKKQKQTPQGKAGCTFEGLRDRCNNPNNNNYVRYGGKGVQIKIKRKRYVDLNLLATHCALCGCEFITGDSLRCKTTDRIDSKGHYEENNIQFLCNYCNSIKDNPLKAKSAGQPAAEK